MPDNKDEWGRDPSVQRMRRIFSDFEKVQNSLLKKIKISLFDGRLRNIRTTARDLFDKSYSLAVSKGKPVDDRAMADLYRFSFLKSFRMAGVGIPKEILPKDMVFAELVNEVAP